MSQVQKNYHHDRSDWAGFSWASWMDGCLAAVKGGEKGSEMVNSVWIDCERDRGG